jgi:hypothetical protein
MHSIKANIKKMSFKVKITTNQTTIPAIRNLKKRTANSRSLPFAVVRRRSQWFATVRS